MKDKDMPLLKKITISVTSILFCAILLSGCSVTPPASSKPVVNNLSERELSKEMVHTFCLLKDRSIVTSEDIAAFRNLAEKMSTYDGDNFGQVRDTAKNVSSVANTYETAIGVDLGKDAALKHTAVCNSLTKRFNEEYSFK